MSEDRVALVTGAATGIGRATAILLADKGLNITVNYSRSEAEAISTAKACEALGSRAILARADVSDDVQVRKMVSDTIDAFGRLDILVNNAGTTYFVEHADLEGLKTEHWDRIMDVNVKGVFYCCRAAAPELKRHKGCIVNITSVAGLKGIGSSIAYAASKAAAISMTKSLARALAPEVRVNSVAPGIVNTRWVRGQEEHVRRYGEGTPMGRVADAQDVAEVVAALVDQAGFVTGQTVVVDGGLFI